MTWVLHFPKEFSQYTKNQTFLDADVVCPHFLDIILKKTTVLHLVPCRCMDFYEPIRQFFYNLIHPEYSAVTDVYVLMFLADTVDFIIIVFGFWAFGVGVE